MMNENMRKKILKELKVLLKEQQPAPESIETGTRIAGSYGNGGLGRTIGTAGAVGGAGYGLAAAGVSSIMGVVVFPVVAVAALVLGAAYLAFRTAGWKEVSEDLDDGKFVTDDDVATKLSTKKYLDLTVMEDATDEADMKSFMAAMKGLANSYNATDKIEEYAAAVQSIQQHETLLKKICNQFVLLNEFGQNDQMYFVKCAKVSAYQPPTQSAQPVAEIKESLKRYLFEQAGQNQSIQRTQSVNSVATSTPAPPAVAAPKCRKLENIQLPSILYKIGLENDISNSPTGYKAPTDEPPLIICPLIEKMCGAGDQPPAPKPGEDPTPKPGTESQTGGQNKNSFGCKEPLSVGIFQQYIGVVSDCKIGPKTIEAARAKGLKLSFTDYFPNTDKSKEPNQQAFCQSLITNKQSYINAITEEKKTPITKCGGGGGGGKGKVAAGGGAQTRVCSDGSVSIIKGRYMALKKVKNNAGVDINLDNNIDQSLNIAVEYLKLNLNIKFDSPITDCEKAKEFVKYIRSPLTSEVKESLNFYDSKKLNEAKKLFERLLKAL